MAVKGKRAKRHSSGGRTIAAVIAGSAALTAGIFLARRRRGKAEDGSSAADLGLDQPHHGPDDRAAEDFRPDPTAPVPDDRRDAMAPATLPNPVNAEPII